MKAVSSLLALVVAASVALGQSWNDVDITSLNIGTSTPLHSTVDFQGVHVVYWSGGSITYALLSPTGSVIRSGVTIASASGPATLGTWNGKIYAAYTDNSPNTLYIAWSTDGGSSWSTGATSYALASGDAAGLDLKTDSRGAHVVWGSRDLTYRAIYVRYDPNYDDWFDGKNVTDETYQTSTTAPSVALSPDRVHVSFTPVGPTYGRVRDFEWGGPTWYASQAPASTGYSTYYEALAVANGNINSIYQTWETYGTLRHFFRGVNSAPPWTEVTVSPNTCNRQHPLWSTTTADGKIHAIYTAKNPTVDNIIHRYYDGSSWSSYITTFDGDQSFYEDKAALAANGNDLYVVSKSSVMFGRVTLRKYEAAPTAPTGLSGTTSSNHPVLSWTRSPEADVYSNTTNGYEIYRRDWSGRTELVRDWTKIAQVSGTTTTYTDTEIWYNQSGNDKVDYEIRAVDAGGQASSYSSIIWFGCELPKPVVEGVPRCVCLGHLPESFQSDDPAAVRSSGLWRCLTANSGCSGAGSKDPAGGSFGGRVVHRCLECSGSSDRSLLRTPDGDQSLGQSGLHRDCQASAHEVSCAPKGAGVRPLAFFPLYPTIGLSVRL